MNTLLCERRTLWIALLLISLTSIVYWPVGGHPFITLDDEVYVTGNPEVLRGLTPETVHWAFTAFHASNWHPLTWLSHMADVEFFGAHAGWHHRVNLLLHIANTLILFLVLRRMTGAVWRSGFVAALFAVHPLHVESVAWIAERKDLLCALFWLLATWAYWKYTARGGRTWYIAVTVFFLLGLMSKPMIVTLPFVFLLLDYWPLRRITGIPLREESGLPAVSGPSHSRLLLEKTPWFLMSLASSIVTYIAQRAGGAMAPTKEFPFLIRAGNAAVSYGRYLGKFFWPDPLVIFYTHPAALSAGLPWWQLSLAILLLAGGTWVACRWRHTRPYLLFGWLLFLGTLVPVIGLVQVGTQGMADRYMYLPAIGISIIIAWGIHDLLRDMPRKEWLAGIAGVAALLLLSSIASAQVGRWRDSPTLFRYAASVTPENWAAYFHLSDALLKAGREEEAIPHIEGLLRSWPDNLDARINLGIALGKLGRYQDAAVQFQEVLRRRPDEYVAFTNLGAAFDRLGRNDEALACIRSAARLRPGNAESYTNLGAILLKMGRREEAIAQLRHALLLYPGDPVGNRLMRAAVEGGGGPAPQSGFRQ